jgi:peptide/nickel transport system substrate-binding protein
MTRVTQCSASRLAAAMVLALILAACGGQAAAPPPPSQPTAAPAAPKPTEAPKPAAPAAAQPTAAPAAAPKPAEAAKPAAQPAAPAKDTVVVAQSSTGANATTLDMAGVTGWFNEAFNIHEPLVKLVFEGDQVQYKPGVAESWKIVDDKTYEFKIRKGVKFHNGDTVTANDVAFSLNRILDKENKLAALTYFQYFNEAKVVDDSTVVFTTKDPYSPAIPRLTFLTIVPEKVVKEMGQDAFSIKPIGAGPYKLVEWVKGESVRLEAHPDYYLGAPKIPKVTFRNVKEPATKIAMLQSGEADLIDNVPPANVPALQANQNLELKIERTVRMSFFGFNALKADPNPFRDIRVRQAINYAIDWDTLLKNVMRGQGIRIASAVGGRNWGYDPELKPWPYDLEKAKQLMAEAGYANGFETTLDGSTGRLLLDKEIATAVAAMLEKNLNIKSQLFIVDWPTYFDKYVNKQIDGLFFFSCGNLIADADLCLQLNLHSKVRGIYYNSPTLDGLMDDQARTVEPAQRLEKLKTVQKAVQDEAAIVFGYDEAYAFAWKKGLKWSPRADEWLYFYGAEWQ